MSSIQFESSRVKEAERDNLRRAREKILAEAEEQYHRKEAQAEKARLRGDDKWMLPSVEAKLSSEKSKKKKKKKDKKEKKSKKSKKKKRRRSTSSSASDSSAEEEKEWVEKLPEVKQQDSKPQQREEWMNLSSAFACSSREKRVKKDDEKKETCILDKPGQNSRELNPHWKNGGTGLPEEEEVKKTDTKFMDAGWLRKSLQRAKEQAAEEGKTLEEIAANRWGSLDKIKSMIQDAENKSRHSSASSSSRRYPDDERRRNQHRNRSRSRSRSRDRSRRYHDNNKSDFNFDKKLSFKRPDDNNSNVDSSSYSRPWNSSRKNWKKPEAVDEKYKNIDPTPSTSIVNSKKPSNHSSSSSSSSESGEDEAKVPNAVDKILTEDELNKLGAKIIKAEIMGDLELAEDLRKKLEEAREARTKNPKPIDTVNKKEEENVILTTTNSRGMARPLEPRSRFDEPQGGRRKSKKVSTHESGERVRYFADDDKYSLQEMFQREKGESSSHQDDAVFVKMASKSMDMDELFESRITKDESDAKQDMRDKMRAIKEHKKIEKSLDSCSYCFDSKKMLKHLIVAMGTKMYVSLPSYESLTSGHCIIAPIHHVTCQTQLDEDFYSELVSFKKALTRMFTEHNECPVFFEVAMGLRRYPHMQLICVSLPEDVGSMAPMYFKKALLECETEWSTNKKVVDLSKKDVRASIPKGLPYFMVDFGDYGGFAHVIEDEDIFPKNFAQEIIGGMMDLDSNMWRRPRKQNFDQQRKKVIEFSEKWKKYDITM